MRNGGHEYPPSALGRALADSVVMKRIFALFLALPILAAACAAEPLDEPAEEDATAIGEDEGEDDPEPEGADPQQGQFGFAAASKPDLIPGCTARGNAAGTPAWFHFTRPDKPCAGPVGMDTHIIDELIRLIESVPNGGRIDAHIFSIKVENVAKALYEAQAQRNVQVWLSTDGQVADYDDGFKAKYLDKLAHRVYCKSPNRRGCISGRAKSISHTKLFTFSGAKMPDGTPAQNVVWLGSANQTYASGMRATNNTVTFYGDAALYGRMRGYLDDLYDRRTTDDYYVPASGRGHYLTASADVYASPEAQTDIVLNRLDDIRADGNCEIDVQQASIRDSRLDVVKKLAALKRDGCKVRVVAHTVEPAARKILKDRNIPIHAKRVHDKVFVVNAVINGKRQMRVFTGSHNLSGGAAHRYDEIFVKLAAETGASHPVYDAYRRHFADAFDP